MQFEKSLTELEALVKLLEQGDSSLEDCLKHYEKGMFLARKCQEALTTAEQKIEVLRSKNVENSANIDRDDEEEVFDE